MQINNEIFEIVDFTAVGILTSVAAELGMNFTSAQLAEFIMKTKTDDSREIMTSFDMLVGTNLLLLQNERYYVNSDYIILD